MGDEAELKLSFEDFNMEDSHHRRLRLAFSSNSRQCFGNPSAKDMNLPRHSIRPAGDEGYQLSCISAWICLGLTNIVQLCSWREKKTTSSALRLEYLTQTEHTSSSSNTFLSLSSM